MRRRGFTLVEALVALGLVVMLVGVIVWLMTYGASVTSRLTPQLGLQQASRQATVRLLRELQEGMEVLTPRPGATAPYALVRDKLSRVRWFYQVPGPDRTMDLHLYTDDPALAASARDEVLMRSVRRLMFSSRTEGALQVNLVIADGAQESAVLTTVRLRNIASAEEIW